MTPSFSSFRFIVAVSLLSAVTALTGCGSADYPQTGEVIPDSARYTPYMASFDGHMYGVTEEAATATKNYVHDVDAIRDFSDQVSQAIKSDGEAPGIELTYTGVDASWVKATPKSFEKTKASQKEGDLSGLELLSLEREIFAGSDDYKKAMAENLASKLHEVGSVDRVDGKIQLSEIPDGLIGVLVAGKVGSGGILIGYKKLTDPALKESNNLAVRVHGESAHFDRESERSREFAEELEDAFRG